MQLCVGGSFSCLVAEEEACLLEVADAWSNLRLWPEKLDVDNMLDYGFMWPCSTPLESRSYILWRSCCCCHNPWSDSRRITINWTSCATSSYVAFKIPPIVTPLSNYGSLYSFQHHSSCQVTHQSWQPVAQPLVASPKIWPLPVLDLHFSYLPWFTTTKVCHMD